LLSTTTLLLVTAIIFLASFILGITSFGFALVAVPLLNLIFPLQLLVPVLIIYGVFINGLVLLPIYKHLDLKGMQYLVGAGILGVPLGTYLLLILDESILKISIGIIIIISAWALYTGYRVNIKNQNLGNAVAGFISGLLNGSLTMSGPPVILFYSNQNLEKQVFRANLAFYFMLTNIITLPVLYGGEQQMLAIGRALMAKPELLLMDEPSMGLAPLLVKEIFEIIKDINKRGTTILLVEQNANMALSIADKAYVIETGEIVLQGTAQELMNSEQVKKAYLGG
jgi:uncharacterized membrane protein YfcA